MFDRRHATVVVIDDDASLRDSLGALIASAGYHYRSYNSAEAYLNQRPPKPPGCVLLDLHLPSMGGLELQRQLNARKTRLPILFLSADASAEETREAMAGGALDLVLKPFCTDHLLERIVCGLRRSTASA